MITLITVCQGLHLTNHRRYQLHTLPHLILNKLLIMMNAHITDRADLQAGRAIEAYLADATVGITATEDLAPGLVTITTTWRF